MAAHAPGWVTGVTFWCQPAAADPTANAAGIALGSAAAIFVGS